ncbi:MAG: replication factor C large subunit [Methanomassiliicoccaceae archaeon]|nr:replication factor C large subunit [Methanomassiliicoccaceae archaeon]
MSHDWTERYRPDGLSKVIGNPKAVTDLKAWADSWDNGVPKKKAAVLMGPPGVGKTSAAIAVANDKKWDILEMNASDQRTGDAIRNIAIKGANFNTFSGDGEYMNVKEGKRKLIVLDEADNLFGNEDRGALPAISELIRTTKQPVILIVNDFYALSKKSSVIKSDTVQITFTRPMNTTVAKALQKIALSENIVISDDTILKIAENSNGDIRAAVRDLESLAFGRRNVTSDDTEMLSDRVVRKGIFDLMKAVFREKDAMKARRMMIDVDETPDHIMLWMDENMPSEFTDKGDLMRGYEKLSRADIFLGRVGRRQYFGLWSYAGDIMSAGVNVSKWSNINSYEKFRFPLYLAKMSRSKSIRTVKANVCSKLSVMLHTSTHRISSDILPMLKEIIKNDRPLAKSMVNELNLEAEEIGFLMDAKIDSDAVKELMLPVRTNIPDTVEKKQEIKKEVPAGNQKSLFQF